jgi:hypothetical protein
MSDDRKVIRVSADSEKAIKAYAEKRGVSVGEAADALLNTAVSRLNALARYAKNKEPQAPGKPRKKAAAKKAAPKAKAKAKPAAKKTAATAANGLAAHAN